MFVRLLANLKKRHLHEFLLKVDEEIASPVRAQGCDCGGALHAAPFQRKPRGLVVEPELCKRLSFCCAVDGCRGRVTPPSVRFLQRKVYWSAVVVIVTAMRCGATPARMKTLRELVGVNRQTVRRWEFWWRQMLPATPLWRARSGLLREPVAVQELPQSLMDRFGGSVLRRLMHLLFFIGPLTGGRRSAAAM
jgi:hypothetical protein